MRSARDGHAFLLPFIPNFAVLAGGRRSRIGASRESKGGESRVSDKHADADKRQEPVCHGTPCLSHGNLKHLSFFDDTGWVKIGMHPALQPDLALPATGRGACARVESS